MEKLKKIKSYHVLYTISIILILLFIAFLTYDCATYNRANSAPIQIFAIVRMLEFFLPSVIIYIIARILHKKRTRKELLDMIFNENKVSPSKKKERD